MHGIASILDSAHYEMVERLWQRLEKECGLNGVKVTPYPHFSWQIAQAYPQPNSGEILREIASQARPFKVYAEGLGIFSGLQPVVFISLARSAELNQLHEQLWQQFRNSAIGLSPHYGPQKWTPHITLIFGEGTTESILCGLKQLISQPFDWEIEVNNLTFISQSGDQVGTLGQRYDFPHR